MALINPFAQRYDAGLSAGPSFYVTDSPIQREPPTGGSSRGATNMAEIYGSPNPYNVEPINTYGQSPLDMLARGGGFAPGPDVPAPVTRGAQTSGREGVDVTNVVPPALQTVGLGSQLPGSSGNTGGTGTLPTPTSSVGPDTFGLGAAARAAQIAMQAANNPAPAEPEWMAVARKTLADREIAEGRTPAGASGSTP